MRVYIPVLVTHTCVRCGYLAHTCVYITTDVCRFTTRHLGAVQLSSVSSPCKKKGRVRCWSLPVEQNRLGGATKPELLVS